MGGWIKSAVSAGLSIKMSGGLLLSLACSFAVFL